MPIDHSADLMQALIAAEIQSVVAAGEPGECLFVVEVEAAADLAAAQPSQLVAVELRDVDLVDVNLAAGRTVVGVFDRPRRALRYFAGVRARRVSGVPARAGYGGSKDPKVR